MNDDHAKGGLPAAKGDSFDAPFQQAWGAPYPAADQTDPTWPDTPTAESEDWRAQGDGEILRSETADPFLVFAEAWVDERGLEDPDSDYGGMLGKAVLEMARTFAAEGHSGTSALLARAYFNWLCDAWDGRKTMILTPEDFDRAVSALEKRELGALGRRLRKIRTALAKSAVAEEKATSFRGIPLRIDRPKGFVQRGTGPDGAKWERTYLYDYGYIPDTQGGDGEGVDVYVGPEAGAPTAYWVAQRSFDGHFDEWKVFLGFPSAARARLAFVLHTPGVLLGPVFELPVAAMRTLLGVEPTSNESDGAEGKALLASMKKSAGHSRRVTKRVSVPTEAAMSKAAEKVAKDLRTKAKKSAVEVSFDEIRSMIQTALAAALNPGAADPTACGPNMVSVWVSDLYDEYAIFGAEGATWKIGYSFGNGVVTFTGPAVQVVRAYVEVNGTPGDGSEVAMGVAAAATTKASVKKDEEPGASAPTGGIGDEPPPGESDGADIVFVAYDRFEDIIDAIEANGGNLSPDLRTAIDGICALLSTITGDDEDEAAEDDGNEDGLAGGEGAPAPMSARAKSALEKAKKAKKDDAEKEKKAKKTAKSFLRKTATQLRLVKGMKDGPAKKSATALLEKAITYGTEAFGTETGFSGAMNSENIPEFTDPSQLKPEEVATPAEETPRGQFSTEPSGTYTPNENSQQAFNAGSAQSMEKLENVRKRLAALGTGTPIAKNHHGWGPSYLAALPDSAFLMIETANKDFAGRSNALQGPGYGFRKHAVRDMTGAVSKAQVQKALMDIPMAGYAEDVKKALTDKATALLKEAESTEASELAKAARGDDGWPDDLNTPEFRSGKPRRVPNFGFDNLKPKAAAK